MEFYLGNTPYTVHSEWDQLTQPEFESLIRRIEQFSSGQISISDCRLLFLCDALGVNLNRIPARKRTDVADKLYTLSRQLTFFTSLKFDEEKLSMVSPELRRKIQKTPPEDLEPTPEVRYLRKQPYTYDVDAAFFANLIPELSVNGHKYQGYRATYSDGLLDTSLTAAQYTNASSVLHRINRGEVQQLPVLAAILYGAPEQREAFKQLPATLLSAIAFNFQAVVLFLFTKTEFAILWKRSSTAAVGDLSLSSADMLYDLSASGYGTPEQVENMALLPYLRILKKNLFTAVTTLREYDKTDSEIAKKVGLPVDLIARIR